MMLIRTALRESPIEGIGVFAVDPIPKGAVVWVLDPLFDREITQAEYDSFPQIARDYIDRYAYVSKQTANFVMDGDHGRYANHSVCPNILSSNSNGSAVAARDIASGEELTFFYPEFSAEPLGFEPRIIS